MNIKKLIVIALLSVSLLTSGCAIFGGANMFSGKRASTIDLVILGNTLKFTSTCDGNYILAKDADKTVQTDSAISK